MFAILIALFVVVFMSLSLLAPNATNNLMRRSQPKEIRPEPSRYPVVQVFCIFVFMIAAFRSIRSHEAIRRMENFDPVQSGLHWMSVPLLLGLGIYATFYPLSFMRTFIPQLKKIDSPDIGSLAADRLFFTARAIGIISVILASYMVTH